MDFAFSEEEQSLRDLGAQIISDHVSHASMRALDERGERVDRATWKLLADAGIISALLPESVGGAGLGMVALGAILEVTGEHAAPLPLLSTVAMSAVSIARFAPENFDPAVLAGVMSGDSLLACAPNADVAADDAGGGLKLKGAASFVLDGLDADHLLVPTSAGWLVADLNAEGIERSPMAATSRRPLAHIELDGAIVAEDRVLPAADAEIRRFIQQHSDTAIASFTLGLCTGAIQLMADHAQQRHQFDRPIASFQAVSQRAGDAFIDNLVIELTTHQAAWRLDAGLDAEREIAIARWWAAEGSYRIIHAASHIHGGIGVDFDYPLHRFILLARQLELTLGSSEQQLEKLGKSLSGP